MRDRYGRVRTACSTSFSSVLYHSLGGLSIGLAKIFFVFLFVLQGVFMVCFYGRSHCTACALAESLCLFFALPQRIGEENRFRQAEIASLLVGYRKQANIAALRGKPLRTPRRVFVGAALSLRATRREVFKIQPLRARLKESLAHSRAKAFAFLPCRAARSVIKNRSAQREAVCASGYAISQNRHFTTTSFSLSSYDIFICDTLSR